MKTLRFTSILAFLMASSVGLSQGTPDSRLILPDKDTILLTVFLKHDQSMNNVERRELLDKSGFNDVFPPDGVEIVHHYVMMGIGKSSCCVCRLITCGWSMSHWNAAPGVLIKPSFTSPMT